MVAVRRKDSRGRNLKDGEIQLADGRYKYQYVGKGGERRAEYSWRLVPTDRVPSGKRDRKDSLCLREVEDKILSDEKDGIDGKKADKITLNDMFDLYMAGKMNLKQSVRTNYTYMYKRYVRDTIGKKPISSIKYSHIKAFYQGLLNGKGTKRANGFKPNSLEIIHTVLHPTFTLGVRDGYIRTNPTDGIMAELKNSHSWEKPKRHALTEEQQELFINFMRESEIYQHWLPFFTFILGTGCRIGEAIGIRWQDCSFEEGTVSINHNLIYRVQDDGHCEMHITTPKTAAGCRDIPMLTDVKNALITERKNQMADGVFFNPVAEVDGYTGFIFTNRNGYVHNPQTINRAIERIRLAANEQEAEAAKKEKRNPVVIPHFSAHNLRHTFCTRFCENEPNVKMIQDIMGHADIGTTMNIYNEATEKKKKESIENLDGKIKIS